MRIFLISILILIQPLTYAYESKVKDTGFKTMSVKPGSTYDKLGIKAGDVLLGYDGKKIENVDDAIKMYSKLNKGKVKNIKLLRDGVEKSLKVQ